MNKSPAFPMYAGDFLSDIKVITMNMEERGVYITLLCNHWIESGLPNDQKELKALCQNNENWEKIWDKLKYCFYERNGKLFNKRLEKEKRKQKAWKKKSQLGGIKSGESRRKLVEPHLNQKKEKVEGCLNTSSSSSSSSSLSNKESSKNHVVNKFTDDDIILTDLLIEQMIKNNDGSKASRMTKIQKERWYNDCRLLRESDKQSIEHIKTVILYTQQDEFEKTVVLSMGKLRKRFDSLLLKASREWKRRGELRVGGR